MSNPAESERPEPTIDTPPDDGPGGPADMIHDEDDHPPATPDQPRSAQIQDKHVPDEIEKPEGQEEDVQEDEKNVDEGTEEPA